MFVAADQREVTDLRQRTLSGIFVRNDKMLALQQRDLLIISNERLWRRDTLP